MSLTDHGAAPAPALVAGENQDPSDMPISRLQRLSGLLIVFIVSLFPLIMWSMISLVRISQAPSDVSLNYRFLNGLVNEVTSLTLLVYVIRQNRQKLADFGLVFHVSDIPLGLLLWAGALCVHSAFTA